MIFVTGTVFFLLTVIIYYSLYRERDRYAVSLGRNNFLIIAALAFLIRIAAAASGFGHETDINCFTSWSDEIFKNGFGAFYSSDIFTDYPPGYMYVLYVIGAVRNIFKINSRILIKLPAIICDILCASVIYRISMRESRKRGFIACIFFLFNPAVILNSSVWGQVDSVFTLFVLITLYLMHTKKLTLSYFSFALAVFIKPQALFYTPLLLFAIYEQVFKNNFSAKKLIKNIIAGISALIMIIILCLPFGIPEVFRQYQSTLSSYNYASVNAYNLWTALGLNWASLNPIMSASGYIFIILTVLAAGIIFSKKQKNRYFMTSAFICFSVFMLSVKMHDRYAYPAIVLMLCSFLISGDKNELFLYAGISAVQFFNAAHVLFYYNPETYYTGNFRQTAVIISILSVILFVYMLKYSLSGCFKQTQKSEIKTVRLSKLTRTDIAALLAITVLYSAAAFYNLGNIHAPQSFLSLHGGEETLIDIGSETDISKISVYLGAYELSDSRTLDIKLLDSDKNTVYENIKDSGSVFCWNFLDDINADARYISLIPSDNVYIGELGISGVSREITPKTFPSQLFDEQDTIPEYQSYKNGTYFDEIYHARTAYEFLHRLSVYEWTHPPLGKIFISLGIKIFGMTPFGWRIAGTLFGIFMLPLMYIFTKKMFGITWLSVCGTLTFAFDFMHFTQSRIATIDVYVTFFILLMYLFMYKYYTMSFYDTPLKKTFVPLGLCGISFGLACACKWTGIYAGAGAAVIFFITLAERYFEKKPEFKNYAVKTILFCILFFVIIPMFIYTVSYIPFLRSNHEGFYGIIQNQIDMLTYHGKTVVSSEHAYSSPWYQWPIIYRPIWYFSGTNGGFSEDISAMGNPLVWWLGIVSFIYCLIKAKNDRTARFLAIAYLAQLLPWVFVTRTTFIYHYFPCVPFAVLMNMYLIYKNSNVRTKKYCIIYTAAVILLFIMFYPAISGFPVKGDYIRMFLRWFPSWQLTS